MRTCLGMVIAFVVWAIIGFALVIGGLAIAGWLAGLPTPDQQLWSVDVIH